MSSKSFNMTQRWEPSNATSFAAAQIPHNGSPSADRKILTTALAKIASLMCTEIARVLSAQHPFSSVLRRRLMMIRL
jgi:hypothetical protein